VTGGGGGSGTVSTVSIATANGFEGTVANATTTPAITLQTTVSGVLKGSGNAIVAATGGTDYQAPITLTTTGTSGAATFSGGTLNIPQYSGGGGAGTVTSFSVAATPSWLASSVATATTTPALTLTAATAQTANEFLATPNGSAGAVGLRSIVAADLPTVLGTYAPTVVPVTSSATPTINMALGNAFTMTLSANVTSVTLTGGTVGQVVSLRFTQAASGGPFTLTTPGGITWFGNGFTAPSMPMTASAVFRANLVVTGSNTYDGFWLGNSAN
jgi:hypothetical protein